MLFCLKSDVLETQSERCAGMYIIYIYMGLYIFTLSVVQSSFWLLLHPWKTVKGTVDIWGDWFIRLPATIWDFSWGLCCLILASEPPETLMLNYANWPEISFSA